jgi:hypothetical protein
MLTPQKLAALGTAGGELSCEDSAGLGKVGVIRRPSELLVNSLGWALAAP